jgi:hypothetical protein
MQDGERIETLEKRVDKHDEVITEIKVNQAAINVKLNLLTYLGGASVTLLIFTLAGLLTKVI